MSDVITVETGSGVTVETSRLITVDTSAESVEATGSESVVSVESEETRVIVTDGARASFEAINRNLAGYPYTYTKTGDLTTSVEYDLGDGRSITKTFNRSGDVISSVVLSGDLPAGVPTTKTYSGLSVSYS